MQFRQFCAVSEIPVQLAAYQAGGKIYPVIKNVRLTKPMLCQIIKIVPAYQAAGITVAQVSHALAYIPREIAAMTYYMIKLS